MSSKVRKDGFELTNILNDESLDIKLWTPDIRFHDAAQLEYLAQVSDSVTCNVLAFSDTIS